MELHESGENYLETILILKQKNGFVRSVDIANEFGFSKPSISRAMKILRNNGYITVNSENQIELTIDGYKRAICIYEKHEFLRKFLLMLGVPEKIAATDACRIEHVISEETFAAIKNHIEDRKI